MADWWESAPIADTGGEWWQAAPVAPVQPNADGTYGQAPADMFMDPRTGGMTSRELLRNNVDPSTLGAGSGGLMQGLGFGLGDEAMGLAGFLEGGPEMANLRQEQARATLEAQREYAPVASIGGEIAGGVGSSLAAAPALGLNTATSLGGRALQGMGLGGIEGALFGFGNAEGAQDRLASTATGAGLGGIIGGAAPYVMAGARAALDPVGGVVASMQSRANPMRASRAVQSAVQRSGRDVSAIQNEINAAIAAGQQYTLADATGNAGQRMLSGVARAPGDARQDIAEFLMNRQSDQGRRIAGQLDTSMNSPRNPGNLPVPYGQAAQGDYVGQTANQVRSGLERSRSATANTQYQAAREGAAPVDVRGALAAIDDRIGGMQGSGVTGDGIDAKLSSYRSRLASQQGDVTLELSDFDRVLGLKQQIGDDIGAAVRAGRNNEARELGKIQRELDAALEGASPDYRAANDTFARNSRTIDAIDTGAAMTSPRARVADNLSTYGGMTPEQQAAARAGYVDPLIGRIENAAPGVNNARPLLSQGSQAELGAMARNPKALADFIRREQTMFETGSTALGGSRTADNLVDIQEVSGLDAGLIANILTGRWGAAAQQAGGTALNAATGRNTATRDQIAQLLLSQDVGQALAPAMHRVQQNISQDRVVEALLRNLQRQSGG